MVSRHRTKRSGTGPFLSLLAAGLLVSACATTDGATPPTEGTVSASPTADASATSAPPRLVAADGTDVTACHDGDCQILVPDGANFGLDTEIAVDGVAIGVTQPNQVQLVVSVNGSGEYVNAKITGTGHLALAQGLTITVEQVDATGAVIRIEPEKNDPKAHQGSGTDGFSLYSGN